MEHFRWQSLKSDQGYLEFLRSASLSAGVYRLTAGAKDPQQPHAKDEVYYVVKGQSKFRSGERETSIGPGDVLFVPAHEPHRFFDITEDLELLVFFAPPE